MKKSEIISWNVKNSKQRIKSSILKDRIITFFTRIVEDLKKYRNPNFYGRIKEIYRLLYPYNDLTNPKEIFKEIKKLNLKSNEGLQLDKEEI